ncbi:sigma-70 family RNA polymerase sigma factor [Streptomyces sp. NPDC001255]|uniref:sigma-70 family RNA polymerase sigma factor n=2 Tax=unclassified Streptomyces TaxID=2593676 RepID=UPI0036B635BD
MSKKDRSEPRTGAGDAGAGTEGVEGPARETVPGQGRGARESGTEQDGARAHVPRQGGHPAVGDGDLLNRARGGDEAAYGELYRRHADGVRRYARTCCRDRDTAEDLTAEVFARTLAALRHGAGPEYAMRAYLLTTVRRVAADWAKTARREQLVDDFAVFAAQAARVSGTDEDTVDLGADVLAMHEAEQSMAVRAFRSLPERWQAVLWHTEVEDESPSEVAVLFGLDANGTRVLASRAREGLKQAYLQAHVSAARTASEGCAAYADRLGAYARGGLRSRAERGLRKHLKECAECRLAASQVKEVAGGIPGLVPLAVIGWFGAAGYGKALALIGGAAGAGAAGSAAAVGGGGAASEGVGAPVKAGIAAGVVATAAVALVLVLAAQEQDKRHPEQPPVPDAKPPAVQPLVPTSPPPYRPAPVAAEPSAPPRVSVPPRMPEPARPTPRPPRPAPASPTPAPSRPSPTPAPPTSPPPQAPAEPVEYRWSTLPYGLTGDGTGPEMRLSASPVWQRPGGMSIGGTRYGHGVSVRIPSETTIDLNRKCAKYEAYAGLDDMTLGLGAARFAVWADGVRLWRSGVLRGGEPAAPVRVGIAGRRTVRLVVEAVDPSALPPAPGGSVAGSVGGGDDGGGPEIGDARGTLGHLGRLGVADWAGSRFTCE